MGTGTGTITGTGDAEKVIMESGEDWISNIFRTPTTYDIEILYDVYATGMGTGTIYYRTATTKAGCADPLAWTEYTGHFTPSNEWMQIKIVA